MIAIKPGLRTENGGLNLVALPGRYEYVEVMTSWYTGFVLES